MKLAKAGKVLKKKPAVVPIDSPFYRAPLPILIQKTTNYWHEYLAYGFIWIWSTTAQVKRPWFSIQPFVLVFLFCFDFAVANFHAFCHMTWNRDAFGFGKEATYGECFIMTTNCANPWSRFSLMMRKHSSLGKFPPPNRIRSFHLSAKVATW